MERRRKTMSAVAVLLLPCRRPISSSVYFWFGCNGEGGSVGRDSGMEQGDELPRLYKWSGRGRRRAWARWSLMSVGVLCYWLVRRDGTREEGDACVKFVYVWSCFFFWRNVWSCWFESELTGSQLYLKVGAKST
jgi:hypothetical protein